MSTPETEPLRRIHPDIERALREGLDELQRRYPKKIGDVRGKGLMLGLEVVADETAGDRTPDPVATAKIFEEAKSRGLLIGKGGMKGNVFRLSPPLTVGEREIDEALAVLTESCTQLES